MWEVFFSCYEYYDVFFCVFDDGNFGVMSVLYECMDILVCLWEDLIVLEIKIS